MTDKFLIVANWKANSPEISNFKFKILNSGLEVAMAAPYPLIDKLPPEVIRAAQDVSQFSVGAYTGEVPAEMLKNLGVKYCLVGHSERRINFGETNSQISKKITMAKLFDITPILCAQTLDEIAEETPYIMYEPASAISTNGVYNPVDPEKIMTTLADWSAKFPKAKFLYGGSVNLDFIDQLLKAKGYQLIAGLVVGHASLNPVDFSAIIEACQSFVAA